jgi:hypothetical protein
MSRSDLPVIRVKSPVTTKRKHFVSWNGRAYAARSETQLLKFKAWLNADSKTLIEL